MKYGGKDEYQFEESNDKIGAIFSKHPLWLDKKIGKKELNKIPTAYVTEEEATESDEGACFYLSYIDFQRTGHPIDAMRTFIHGYSAGLNPPITVQKFLAKAFKSFLESEGTISLNTALGFKNNKTSARRYFLKKKIEERNRTIIHYISKLQFFFPQISDEKVFSMVSESIKDEIENNKLGKVTFGILFSYKNEEKTILSAERVKELYYEFQKGESYKKMFREQEEWGDLDIDLSIEAKKSLLGRIPYREVPSDLKFLHPDHNQSPFD
ncbi:MAG: hypothetical protein AB7P32_12485 [Nitrospirales bacterium]